MTKTVAEVVKEYLAQQNEPKKTYERIVVCKMNGCNSVETVHYSNVTDVNCSVFEEIKLYGMCMYKISFVHADEIGTHRVQVIGKIIEFSEKC